MMKSKRYLGGLLNTTISQKLRLFTLSFFTFVFMNYWTNKHPECMMTPFSHNGLKKYKIAIQICISCMKSIIHTWYLNLRVASS